MHSRSCYPKVTSLAAIVIALTVMSGCGGPRSDTDEDLAVARLSETEIQTSAFLALNDDKPGTPVDPRHYLVRGKYNIVEYFSPYSAPSMTYQKALQQLCRTHTELAVRTIDINRPEIQEIDWESPVVSNEEISSIPYFRIYDPNGSLRAHGRPALEQVMQWTGYRAY